MLLTIAAVVAAGVVQGRAPAPVPPPMVGGVADARSQLVLVDDDDGAIAALELATGKRRWSSTAGRWPLYAGLGVVAVAAPDARRPNVLHLRLLHLSNGRQSAAAAPLVLPAWVIVDPHRVDARRGGGFSVEAWAPPESRLPRRDPRAALWRVRWQATDTPVYGHRLPDPSETRRAEGMVLLDQTTGATHDAPVESPPSTAPPALPPGALSGGLSYWSWSDHGSAWTSAPRVFRVAGSGTWAFLSLQSSGGRRLALHRFRPGELFDPVTLAADGSDTYPVVSEEGRHVVLITSPAGRPVVVLLHDLARGGSRPPVRLREFRAGFRPRIAVIDSHLFYVAEQTVGRPGGATRTDRTLVALDWTTGRERWTHALAPRLQPGPVPGARPR
jgi:hypothetical protein